jgi:pyridoxamine 5'-phosphate oxidase
MNTPSLADMRKNYQQAELLESNAAQHPLQQFTTWLNQAISAEIPEPNAMTLATVSSALRPSTRVALNTLTSGQ